MWMVYFFVVEWYTARTSLTKSQKLVYGSAPVYAYPGEFGLEAIAAGAIRVLDGVESAKEYTGVPRWMGFGGETL